MPAVTASDLKRMHNFRRTLLGGEVARVAMKLLKNETVILKSNFKFLYIL